MATHMRHNTSRRDRGGNAKPQRQASADTPAALEADASKYAKAPMTERRHFVTQMNLTAAADLRRLRELLSPEYDTLARRQQDLLVAARGQYVLIHETEADVYPSIENALEEGRLRYPDDLFFVGRIHEHDIQEYLAT